MNLSGSNRFYGVFSRGKYTTDFTGSLAPNTNSFPLPYTQGRIVEENTTIAQIHFTHVFTPTLLNDFSFSYARIWIPIISATEGGQYPTKAGTDRPTAGGSQRRVSDHQLRRTECAERLGGHECRGIQPGRKRLDPAGQHAVGARKARRRVRLPAAAAAGQQHQSRHRHARHVQLQQQRNRRLLSHRYAAHHHRQCLRELSARSREFSQHHAELRGGTRVALSRLRRLYPG